jgi:hypothetical protein
LNVINPPGQRGGRTPRRSTGVRKGGGWEKKIKTRMDKTDEILG